MFVSLLVLLPIFFYELFRVEMLLLDLLDSKDNLEYKFITIKGLTQKKDRIYAETLAVGKEGESIHRGR